jgi:hypothetical protein
MGCIAVGEVKRVKESSEVLQRQNTQKAAPPLGLGSKMKS